MLDVLNQRAEESRTNASRLGAVARTAGVKVSLHQQRGFLRHRDAGQNRHGLRKCWWHKEGREGLRIHRLANSRDLRGLLVPEPGQFLDRSAQCVVAQVSVVPTGDAGVRVT